MPAVRNRIPGVRAKKLPIGPNVTTITLSPGGESWETAINRFKQGRGKKIRETTLKWYLSNLRSFVRYLNDLYLQDITPLNMTYDDVQDFLDYCAEDLEMQPRTINARIVSLKALYAFLLDRKMAVNNPMDEILELPEDEPEIQTFSPDQLRKLLDQPDRSTFKGFRDYVLMRCLLDLGSRIGETLKIKISRIEFVNEIPQTVWLQETKNHEPRRLALPEKLQETITQWLRMRKEVFGIDPLAVDWLIINQDCNPLHPRNFQRWMREYADRAKITGVRPTPHTLRHTFAKLYIEGGGDIVSLKDILGHKDMRMVYRYARFFGKELIERHRQFAPSATLNI